MSETYYDVLGVDADASQDAIRDAYREKVKEYHPDVSDHADAEEQFKRVKRAEIVLADPEERETYDRLGHDAYVDGDVGGDDPEPNQPSEDEVRWAAAQAAQGDHDAGGRSAGWRQRERRARQYDRTEWFGGGDDDPFDDAGGESTARGSSGSSSGDAASGNADGPEPAGTVGQAAADGWGGTEAQSAGPTVHEWSPEEQRVGVPTPDWSQDDIVLLVSSLLLYPILLFLTVAPAFPTAARVAMGLCAIALVGFLLPRPAFGLPVFGTWSVLVPALLLGFGVSPISAMGLVTLGGVWLPLLYSVAVAMVLAR